VQVVHTGDALTTDAAVPGGSSGIIVDLFSHGQLLQQLTQVWSLFVPGLLLLRSRNM
jgi:hypothetical protein